ncbi:MAG: hypothetical protein SOU19_06685 [Candidatus Caccosoma sp.]|nr:hypothetical protein [Candidatus Caccosoma sp.]
MDKYNLLWKYLIEYFKENNNSLTLSFADINKIASIPLDHSFLKYKKELEQYNIKVDKISLKNKYVIFKKEVDK